ncbi:MAG: M48 family metallopeptidase [Actinobacteria bacterium]|nr:M48 family metallopeptidase [Actinomycetota bacterium]
MEQVNPKIYYRNIRHPRIELKTGELVLILPFGVSPDNLLNKYKGWINNRIEVINNCVRNADNKKIIERSEKEFREIVNLKVLKATNELNIHVNKICIRRMKTKWASCSSKKNITINKLMRFLPDYLIEYIIFHETVHLLERKHSSNFRKIIEKKFNDYKEFENSLFVYWFLLQEV